MKKTLGERIAEKRKALGLKQEELAEALGVSAQAVSKWENDVSCPDIMTLPALAKKLKISVDELLTGETDCERVELMTEEKRRDFNDLVLRIKMLSKDGNKLNINLPMPLIKAGIDAGFSFSSIGAGKVDGLNVDWKTIITLVENGAIGTLMDGESEDGDTVKIVVE